MTEHSVGFYPPILEELNIYGTDGHKYSVIKTILGDSNEHLILTLVDADNPERTLLNVDWTPDSVACVGKEKERYFSYSLQEDEAKGFGIWVDGATILVMPVKGQTVKVQSASYKYVDKFDDSKPDSTKIHEDQHQFNKLFRPLDWKENIYVLVEQVVSRDLPAEQALDELTLGMVRLHRAFIGIDTRARDEILAFYAEGRDMDSIFHTLSEDKIYNYRIQYAVRIAELPEIIQEELRHEVEVLTPEDTYEDLLIIPEKVQAVIEKVFGDDYEEDLKKWTMALSQLEQKGYSRDEVLALAYQEPASRWTNLARRTLDKTKNA